MIFVNKIAAHFLWTKYIDMDVTAKWLVFVFFVKKGLCCLFCDWRFSVCEQQARVGVLLFVNKYFHLWDWLCELSLCYYFPLGLCKCSANMSGTWSALCYNLHFVAKRREELTKMAISWNLKDKHRYEKNDLYRDRKLCPSCLTLSGVVRFEQQKTLIGFYLTGVVHMSPSLCAFWQGRGVYNVLCLKYCFYISAWFHFVSVWQFWILKCGLKHGLFNILGWNHFGPRN